MKTALACPDPVDRTAIRLSRLAWIAETLRKPLVHAEARIRTSA